VLGCVLIRSEVGELIADIFGSSDEEEFEASFCPYAELLKLFCMDELELIFKRLNFSNKICLNYCYN